MVLQLQQNAKLIFLSSRINVDSYAKYLISISLIINEIKHISYELYLFKYFVIY